MPTIVERLKAAAQRKGQSMEQDVMTLVSPIDLHHNR